MYCKILDEYNKKKPKFSDDKAINNNSNNKSCRNMRKFMHYMTDLTPQLLKFGHISQSNLQINTISEYQLKICHKFNNFYWNVCFNTNKFMFLCISSPHNPPKSCHLNHENSDNRAKFSDKWSYMICLSLLTRMN